MAFSVCKQKEMQENVKITFIHTELWLRINSDIECKCNKTWIKQLINFRSSLNVRMPPIVYDCKLMQSQESCLQFNIFNIRQMLLCQHDTHLGCSNGLLFRNVIIEYTIHKDKISTNVLHGATCIKDDLQWENKYIYTYVTVL